MQISTCLSLTLFELQQHSVVAGVAAEVASALVIPEQPVLPELQLLRPPQPLRLQRGLVQVQQAANDEGVVIQEARDGRRSGEHRGSEGDEKSKKWERSENEDSFH